MYSTYCGLLLVGSYVQAGWISVHAQAIARLIFHVLGGGEWPFEIAGFVRLGIVRELACLLGGWSGGRIVHRK